MNETLDALVTLLWALIIALFAWGAWRDTPNKRSPRVFLADTLAGARGLAVIGLEFIGRALPWAALAACVAYIAWSLI